MLRGGHFAALEEPEATFFPTALLPAPVLLVALVDPEYLYFRYFVVVFPFFYVLLAHSASACLEFPHLLAPHGGRTWATGPPRVHGR